MNNEMLRQAVASALQNSGHRLQPTKKVKADKRDQQTKEKQAQRAKDEARMMAALNKLHAKDEKKRKRSRTFKPSHMKHPKQRKEVRKHHPAIWENYVKDMEAAR